MKKIIGIGIVIAMFFSMTAWTAGLVQAPVRRRVSRDLQDNSIQRADCFKDGVRTSRTANCVLIFGPDDVNSFSTSNSIQDGYHKVILKKLHAYRDNSLTLNVPNSLASEFLIYQEAINSCVLRLAISAASSLEIECTPNNQLIINCH